MRHGVLGTDGDNKGVGGDCAVVVLASAQEVGAVAPIAQEQRFGYVARQLTVIEPCGYGDQRKEKERRM